jgi:hypothetical protein
MKSGRIRGSGRFCRLLPILSQRAESAGHPAMHLTTRREMASRNVSEGKACGRFMGMGALNGKSVSDKDPGFSKPSIKRQVIKLLH